jgi:hypothetical protein
MRPREEGWAQQDEIERQVRRLFRLGVKRCCVTAMWTKLAEYAGKVHGAATPATLAEVLKVTRSNTNAFADGQMELETLCLMLAAVDQPYRLLDDPPTLDDRILCGYLEACHWLVEGDRVPSKRLSTLRSDFTAVCMVLRDDEYAATLEFTKRQWASLAEHVGRELDRNLPPDLLRELVEKWGEPLMEAVDHIASTFGWGKP